MNVIFLDIDGVLNYSESESRNGLYLGIDSKRIKNLAKIVAATDAKIVLTSTWKDSYVIGGYKDQCSKTGKYSAMRDVRISPTEKVMERLRELFSRENVVLR